MKKLLALTLLLGIGICGFCEEVFDRAKAVTLHNTYLAKQKAGNPDAPEAHKAWRDYLIAAKLNTEAADNYMQLFTLIPQYFKDKQIANPTAAQISARIDELWVAENDPENRREMLKAYMYARHRLPDAIIALNDEKRYAAPLWSAYQFCRDYGKALETAVKYENWRGAFDTAKRLNDRAKIFEFGRKYFLETYIPTPDAASKTLTEILRPNYAGVIDNEEIAAFLKEISMRYPAPDADMEAWRGFLGFVGYRYKTLTRQDLFTK